MSRILEKNPTYSISIIVVLLNLAVMVIVSIHLLNNLNAAAALSQSLGNHSDWHTLILRDKASLFGSISVICLMGVGALLELGKRPLAALLNPAIPTVGIVLLIVQLLIYDAPGAPGETGIVLILIGVPMLLMAVVYTGIYWKRIRAMIRTRSALDN